MKFTTLAVLASSLAPALASYPITGDSVNCRSGPGTSYGVKKVYAKGHSVTLSCQTTGINVNGNSIWDKTSDGCYVADYYVKTGTSGYVTKKCGSTSTCVAPKSNQATVDLIAEFEGFVNHVCECLLTPSPLANCSDPWPVGLVLISGSAWANIADPNRHRRDWPPDRRLRPPVQQLQVLGCQVQDPPDQD